MDVEDDPQETNLAARAKAMKAAAAQKEKEKEEATPTPTTSNKRTMAEKEASPPTTTTSNSGPWTLETTGSILSAHSCDQIPPTPVSDQIRKALPVQSTIPDPDGAPTTKRAKNAPTPVTPLWWTQIKSIAACDFNHHLYCWGQRHTHCEYRSDPIECRRGGPDPAKPDSDFPP